MLKELEHGLRRTIALPVAMLALAVPTGVIGQELITPERIGRPDAPITITMAPRFAYSHQSNDEKRQQVLTNAFESWILKHPDVKIEVQVQQGDDAVIVAKRLQDAAAGRAADVIMTEDLDFQKFYDLTESFDPYLSESEKADFLPGVLQGMQHPETDEVKYLQITSYTSGLWYRRDLVETPPTSLEELADQAEQLQAEHDFRYGFFVLGGPGIMGLTLLSQTASLGGELMADDVDSTPVFGEGENREILIRVLGWYKDLVDRGIMPTEVVSFAATGDVVSRVAAAEMPFVLGGSFMGGGISGTPEGDKWAFAPMPQLDGAEPVSFQGGWSWAMFSEDPQKQALITDLLMDTYIGPWAMAAWGEAGGYTPTRRSSLTKYTAFTEDRLAASFTEAVSNAIPFPNGRYRNVVDAALTNAFQQVVLGALTPEQAVDEAWATVQLEM